MKLDFITEQSASIYSMDDGESVVFLMKMFGNWFIREEVGSWSALSEDDREYLNAATIRGLLH